MKGSSYLYLKRVLDIIVSLFSLLILSPLLLLISLLVRLYMGTPVIFRQTRPGKSGKPFVMYKFRTMRDHNGDILSDEKRLTPFGKILRSTSLDELPELFNVLKGDMSIVGPRPLLMEYLPLYNATQGRRHEVKPGITGWAQVNGRNAISWEKKFALDVWYVENISLFLDIKIILLTLRQVLKRDGINAFDHATMPPFSGNKNDS